MKKLGENLYNRLSLQAEEAKTLGMESLGEAIEQAIEVESDDQKYSYAELSEEISKDLWKIATRMMAYYDLDSIDAGKLHQELLFSQARLVRELEKVLEVNGIGVSEPKLPGEIG